MDRVRFWAVCVAVAAGSVNGLSAAKGNPEKGKEVFQQCAMCHKVDSDEKKTPPGGPGLKGLFKRDKLSVNGKKVTDSNVRARIDEGGNGMPSYKDMLSDQEKDDLIAYLKTL